MIFRVLAIPPIIIIIIIIIIIGKGADSKAD